MRQYNGVTINVDREILGRITKKRGNRFAHSDSILVSNNINNRIGKYSAVVTSNRIEEETFRTSKNLPIVHSIKDVGDFNEGDVVLIEPDGRINKLYEKESDHNAVMITEQCNCSCVMCPQEVIKQKDDKTSFNLKLISLMDKATKYLAFTGGEPTLVGDSLFEIIKRCKDVLPSTSIIILTNGILFSNFEYAKKLAMIEHPNLTIAVALYADTDNEHNYITQTKGFYKTIQAIYNLALFRQKIELRTVITKLNYKRLPNFSEFIYRNFPFVVHIAFMGMETRELAEKNINLLWIDPYDYIHYLKNSIDILDRRMMNVSIYNHQLCVLPKNLWIYSRQSISAWKNIYLEECKLCSVKERCGGLFLSSEQIHSKHIKKL